MIQFYLKLVYYFKSTIKVFGFQLQDGNRSHFETNFNVKLMCCRKMTKHR